MNASLKNFVIGIQARFNSKRFPEKMQAIVDFKNYNIPEKFLWLKNIGKIKKKRNVKNI